MILPRAADLAGEAYNMLLPRITSTRSCRYDRRYCRSPWSRFGRWILVGVLILFALLVVFALLALRQRRRRRAMTSNATPMNTQQAYAPNNQQAGYGNQGYNNGPQYPPQQQQYGAGNEGYYGQQNGVAQPQNTYQQGYK